MTYPPDPQQPEQPGGYPPPQPEQQPGYQQQPEQPSGYYQQPGGDPYAHAADGTGQYPPTGVYQTQQAGGGKSFFGSLFDFSFRSFVTPQVLQIYYVVGLVVLGIGVLFGLISAIVTIASDWVLLGLFQLIMVPVMGFVYLLLLRMGLELVANFFRIGEDVKAMRDKSDRTL